MQHTTKFLLLLTTIIITALKAQSQVAPAIEWQSCLGNSNAVIWSIKQTNDNGFIVVGFADSTGGLSNWHGDNDGYVAKLDSLGNIQWQKLYGGSKHDAFTDVTVTKNNTYIIGGYTQSDNGDVMGFHTPYFNNYADAWAVKLDSVGDIIWQHCYGGKGDEQIAAPVETNDGGLVFYGNANIADGDINFIRGSLTNINYDNWVFKTDSLGNILWNKTYGSYANDGLRYMIKTNDNGFIFIGGAGDSTGDCTKKYSHTDIWVVKLDSIGNLQWQKTFGGSKGDYAEKVTTDEKNNYLISGTTMSNDFDVTNYHGGFGDIWLLKIDSIGNLLWQKTIGGSSTDNSYAHLVLNNKDIVVAAQTESSDDDFADNTIQKYAVLMLLDSNANIKWKKYLGGTNVTGMTELISLNNNALILAGSAGSIDGDVVCNPLKNAISTPWIIKLGASLLPIAVSNFYLNKVIDNINSCSIEVVMRLNNVDFVKTIIIQRSIDGNFFEDIKSITPSKYAQYKYLDVWDGLKNNATIYYRIKTIYINGNYDYSVIKQIASPCKTSNKVLVYPNPASTFINVISNNISQIFIYNTVGVLEKSISCNSVHTKTIDVSNLTNGNYYIKIVNNKGNTEYKSLIKL